MKYFFMLSILLLFMFFPSASIGESEEPVECYILCNPETYINIRTEPNKHSIAGGWAGCGDSVYPTGKTKGKWSQIVSTFDGYDYLWVITDYIVPDQPERITGYVITTADKVHIRKTPGGDSNGRVKKGTRIRAYARSHDWICTNRGYISTEFVIMEDDENE